jgi:hypothetical protein
MKNIDESTTEAQPEALSAQQILQAHPDDFISVFQVVRAIEPIDLCSSVAKAS